MDDSICTVAGSLESDPQAIIINQYDQRSAIHYLLCTEAKPLLRKPQRASIVTAFHVQSQSVELFFVNVKISNANRWILYQVIGTRLSSARMVTP